MSNLTFILADSDTDNLTANVVYVLRDNATGEVYLRDLTGDTRDHAADRDRWDAYGVTVLTVIEGERDLSTGDASAWVAR